MLGLIQHPVRDEPPREGGNHLRPVPRRCGQRWLDAWPKLKPLPKRGPATLTPGSTGSQPWINRRVPLDSWQLQKHVCRTRQSDDIPLLYTVWRVISDVKRAEPFGSCKCKIGLHRWSSCRSRNWREQVEVVPLLLPRARIGNHRLPPRTVVDRIRLINQDNKANKAVEHEFKVLIHSAAAIQGLESTRLRDNFVLIADPGS